MRTARLYGLIIFSSLVLSLSFSAQAEDAIATDSPAISLQKTNDAESASAAALTRLQAQIQELKSAIEKNRLDSEEAVSANSKDLANRLETLEQSLAAQRTTDLQAAQKNNQTLILGFISFAAFCCLALIFAAYLQWRGMKRFDAISSLMLAQDSAPRALSPLATAESAPRLVEQSNARLSAAVERIEMQLKELEQTPRLPLSAPPPSQPPFDLQPGLSQIAPVAETTVPFPLTQENLDDAVAHFTKLLAKTPDNAELLVKKGSALERLHRLKEALECYDRAIALDSSITLP